MENGKAPKCGHYVNRAQRGCPECQVAYEARQAVADPLATRRRLAGKLARLALARGDIKPTPCEECGSKQVEMHHTDYSKPLQVRFLCRFHHQSLHGLYRGLNRKINNSTVDKRQRRADTSDEAKKAPHVDETQGAEQHTGT